MENSDFSKKKYRVSFWLVFSLILNGYATGIPGLSIGSAVLIALIAFAMLDGLRGKRVKVSTDVFFFGGLVTLSSLIGVAFLLFSEPQASFQGSQVLIGAAKFWLWVIMVSVVAINYYDETSIRIWMCRFSIILTVYIIVQSIAFYAFHFYLPNIFNFGPLHPYVEAYADYERLSRVNTLRPASLLSESSFYGNFIICTMALYLNKNIYEINIKSIFFVAFSILGVVLSGSTSAIIMLGFILFLFYRRIKTSKKWTIAFLVGMGVVIFLTIWPNISSGSIGNSLLYAFEKFNYLGTSTRFGKSFNYLSFIPDSVRVFGSGIGNDVAFLKPYVGTDSIYLNSVTSLIIQTGAVGCIFFVGMIIRLAKKSFQYRDLVALSLLITYFVKGFASGIYFSTYGVLFMFIILGQLGKGNNQSYETK